MPAGFFSEAGRGGAGWARDRGSADELGKGEFRADGGGLEKGVRDGEGHGVLGLAVWQAKKRGRAARDRGLGTPALLLEKKLFRNGR